jgi:hypothetical protein
MGQIGHGTLGTGRIGGHTAPHKESQPACLQRNWTVKWHISNQEKEASKLVLSSAVFCDESSEARPAETRTASTVSVRWNRLDAAT